MMNKGLRKNKFSFFHLIFTPSSGENIFKIGLLFLKIFSPELDANLSEKKRTYFFSNPKPKIIIFSLIGLVGLYSWVYYSFRRSPYAVKQPPNVVLIIIDTLRADKLGCYGYPENVSPEIDGLAAQGVRFENVIAQCSWTRPSIGSMLTSLHPRSLGLYKEKHDILNDTYLTLAEILKNNGYSTIGITANPHINQAYNFHQGFDLYIDSPVIHFPRMKKNEAQKFVSKENPFYTAVQIFNIILPKLRVFSNFPVYLQINLMDVHERHSEAKFAKLGFDKNEKYLKSIRQVSYDIDIFIKDLLSIPGWGNTLFVITSDHGEGLDDHDRSGLKQAEIHGFYLYESQVRVPLILYHPGGDLKTMVIKRPVRLLDLMPTILDSFLNIPLPASIQGKSLKKLLMGTGMDLPEYFVTETNLRSANKIAVYSDKWKYIENRDNQRGVNRYELQPVGIMEGGKFTDKIIEEPETAQKMSSFLVTWERNHLKATSTQPGQSPSPEEINQLKSLGYLHGSF